MRARLRQAYRVAACAALLAAGLDEAAAGCTRRVYNRSAYTLVASQDGGPAFVLRPGTSRPIRLSRPGHIDLAAYCGRFGQGLPGVPDVLAPQPAQVAQAQFSYEAVLDRCYIEFGTQFFDRALGRGFLGMQGTKPFTLNNPRQGDIILGPFSAPCPPVR